MSITEDLTDNLFYITRLVINARVTQVNLHSVVTTGIITIKCLKIVWVIPNEKSLVKINNDAFICFEQ